MHSMTRQLKGMMWSSFYLVGILGFTQGCGVVGPPLPPEDIGIEAKIRAQKKAAKDAGEQGDQEAIPLDQQDAPLPPLKPVGSQ